jgi:hypothetical protein
MDYTDDDFLEAYRQGRAPAPGDLEASDRYMRLIGYPNVLRLEEEQRLLRAKLHREELERAEQGRRGIVSFLLDRLLVATCFLLQPIARLVSRLIDVFFACLSLARGICRAKEIVMKANISGFWGATKKV